MELKQLVQLMVEGEVFHDLINNPLAQFGPRTNRLLGATLLPEKTKTVNEFKEGWIQYRSIVANAGTRYSPPQLKGNSLTGSMLVELAESDIASEFTAQDYDAVIDLIKDLPEASGLDAVSPQAMALMFRWADSTLNMPLLEFNERCRWQAIVDANVELRGDNNFAEDVAYSDPADHRFNAGGTWSNNSYDPMDDIQAAVELLGEKGYTASRFIAGTPVVSKLLANTKIKQRLGMISIASGSVVGLALNASLAKLNDFLREESLPIIEKYDAQFRTQEDTDYYLARDVFVICATTGRDEDMDLGDDNPFVLPNTLGYTAIGRPANRNQSGRAIVVEYNDKKGAPVYGQSWQTSLPVIIHPEAISVIKSIS